MRAGRCPSEIRLIAVSKTVGADLVLKAIDNGQREFGENRVQEAQEKITHLGPSPSGAKVIWHMIGHLQKNKAGTAVELFDLIHSVDSAELAGAIDRHARKAGKVQEILVQVKLAAEESKHGAGEEDVYDILRKVRVMENLNLRGLMTIPPFFDEPERARPYFRRLREIKEKAAALGFALPELSMGMSGDFEVAIEEGATMVRVGSSIFGERK